jgi:hypothetical protein
MAISAGSRRSPVDHAKRGCQPPAPSGSGGRGDGDIAELRERFGDAKDDALLAAEVASLAAVHEALASGEYFCTIIEPMQSEGGDRFATERFFRGLRLLTRYHQTFLVFDEVQTGFGLGGPFAWHSKFRLLNQRGQQDYPDAVTFATRAQVGVVMSRFADPEQASAHNASLVRGASTRHGVDEPQRGAPRKLVQPRRADRPRVPASGSAPARVRLRSRSICRPRTARRVPRQRSGAARSPRCGTHGALPASDSFLAREVDLLSSPCGARYRGSTRTRAKPPEWEDAGHAGDRTPAAHSYRLVPHQRR